MIASRIGEAPAASEWFRGAVVAYAAEVKFEVLGVTPGPVVTAECASEMAYGVSRLMGSDYGLAITGVGGPGPDEGKPAGTVFIAVCSGERVRVEERRLDGEPPEIVQSATLQALLIAVEFVQG
jgi:nicotinamide-nucleotide amidase